MDKENLRPLLSARAQASPNIALIKYWGNLDHELRIPANSSISITLGDLKTETQVTLDPSLKQDQLTINGSVASDIALARASHLLTLIRKQSGLDTFSQIESRNHFPMGAGIASSASAFAALTISASKAYGLQLDERSLSRLARRASGSAARSICSGFVELHCDKSDTGAYAEMIFPIDHWDLIDIIAVVDISHKAVSSSEGHLLSDSSPIQSTRVADADRRLGICRQALANKDFEQLAHVVELDSNLMHAVMMTSTPRLFYWKPETLTIMRSVEQWRAEGLEVCYTVDAGPNVHCICTSKSSNEVMRRLESLELLQELFLSKPGPGALLL
jgi:diphosphomevalonate decarboxylase